MIIENTLLRIQRSMVSKKSPNENASAKNRNKWWIKTEMTVYLIKLANPSWVMLGVVPFSMSSREETNWAIPGRKKPSKTVAPAWIPGVFPKMSIVIPRIKEIPSYRYPGMVNGSNRINRMYMYGLTNPLNWMLFRISTWTKTSTKNIITYFPKSFIIHLRCLIQSFSIHPAWYF